MSKMVLFAAGAGLSPVGVLYGLGSYYMQRESAVPTLPLGPGAGLTLGIVSLVIFAACVWGLHLSLAEHLRRKRDATR